MCGNCSACYHPSSCSQCSLGHQSHVCYRCCPGESLSSAPGWIAVAGPRKWSHSACWSHQGLTVRLLYCFRFHFKSLRSDSERKTLSSYAMSKFEDALTVKFAHRRCGAQEPEALHDGSPTSSFGLPLRSSCFPEQSSQAG